MDIDTILAADITIALLAVILIFLVLRMGIKVVPQSEVFVIERFGKYARTLNAGLSIIIPFLDRVAHRVSILERQLDEQRISVITKDNVEVRLETRVFYRVTEAPRSVYRIRNVNDALITASSSIGLGLSGAGSLLSFETTPQTTSPMTMTATMTKIAITLILQDLLLFVFSTTSFSSSVLS